MTTPTAFVTGGSGFVGARLIPLLISSGYRVTALVRSRAAADAVRAAGATPAAGDLTDAGGLRDAMAGCDVAFHAAGLLKEWGRWREFQAVNVTGTRAVVEAATAAGVGCLVQVGAAAVVMGEPAAITDGTEAMPLQSPRWAPYIATKAAAERIVLAANGPAFRTAVVRPPFIWGPGSPVHQQLVRQARAGQFRWVDEGRQRMSTCHVDNVCQGALLAARHGRGGQAYFLTDGGDTTLRQVVTDLLATAGVAPPTASLSFSTAWRVAAVLEAAFRLLPARWAPPITRQTLRMIGQTFTVSDAKARAELGYRPAVAWADGLRELKAAAS